MVIFLYKILQSLKNAERLKKSHQIFTVCIKLSDSIILIIYLFY